MKCEGSCEERGGHVGEVKKYHIAGWNVVWNYCEEAYAEDQRRGLKIWLADDEEAE